MRLFADNGLTVKEMVESSFPISCMERKLLSSKEPIGIFCAKTVTLQKKKESIPKNRILIRKRALKVLVK